MSSLRKQTLLAGVAALLAAGVAEAQDTHAATETSGTRTAAAVPPDRPTIQSFNQNLSSREAGALLGEMRQLAEQALAVSRSAEQAPTVAAAKAAADRVLQAVWGLPSRISGEAVGEVEVPGWKERFQVTGGEFDPRFVQRYGQKPPTLTDPRQLGLMGRGLAVRARLEKLADPAGRTPAAQREAADRALASLNDVIGWVHMTKGYKGREVQPRASLTHMWDQPTAFWMSSADTGWLHEVYSQATNILKTDYAGDAAEARKHVAGMSELLQKVLNGVDADRNGTVEAKIMEGGLLAALAEAGKAGVQAQ